MLISPIFAEAKTACLEGRDIRSDRRHPTDSASYSAHKNTEIPGGPEDIMHKTNFCLDQALTARRSQEAAAKLGGTPQYLSAVHGD